MNVLHGLASLSDLSIDAGDNPLDALIGVVCRLQGLRNLQIYSDEEGLPSQLTLLTQLTGLRYSGNLNGEREYWHFYNEVGPLLMYPK